MFEPDEIVNLVLEKLKTLFFPEEWINLDLKFSKFELFTLLFLDSRKEITMTELVDYINTPMSTATGIVDRLVKKGYIQRERSATDRRSVVIKLTATGLQLITGLKEMISEYVTLALEDLSEEEKRFLMRIVLKIMDNLQTKLTRETSVEQKQSELVEIDIE